MGTEIDKKAAIARGAIIVRQAMRSGALPVPYIVSMSGAGDGAAPGLIADAARVVVENLGSESVQSAIRVEEAEQEGGRAASLYPADMDSVSAHETFFAAASEPDSETC